MGVAGQGKNAVSSRIRGGLSHPRPRTHQSVQELPLGGDLIESLGELLCQMSTRTKARNIPNQAKLLYLLHTCGSDLGWSQFITSRPGQFITSTERLKNQTGVQNRSRQAAALTNSH